MSTGKTPAFYALGASGAWKDYVNLLHIPYTLWHLSYVVLGAAVASTVHVDRLMGTLLAFFLAMGIGAHALDEFNGRPLGTRIPSAVLVALAIVSLTGALVMGTVAGLIATLWLFPFHGLRRFHRRRLQSGSLARTGSTPTSGLPSPGGLSRP